MQVKKLNSNLILAILATGLMSFCGVVVETATNVTFPTLMKEFGVNTATVQWMTTGYLLVASIMMPLSAYLKHNFTSKKLFTIAASLFAIGLIVNSIAPRLPSTSTRSSYSRNWGWDSTTINVQYHS